MTVTDPNNGRKSFRRIPLDPATTHGEAVKAMNKLKVQREENQLPVLRQTPYLEEVTARYFEFHEKARDAKAALHRQEGEDRHAAMGRALRASAGEPDQPCDDKGLPG
jgi:hypothetical protein